MIRLLVMPLLLLLLPGAESVAGNIDEVHSFPATTLGPPLSMAVTPQTTLGKPSPASHGPSTPKAAMRNPPHLRESENQPGLLKDTPAKPMNIKPAPRGLKISYANTTDHQQRPSTPNGTKTPVTARSHSLDESSPARPVIRKGPTPANKPKMVRKPNTSARYQSLPHLHHKNATLKPETGQLKGSNVTTGPKPQRTVTTPPRNTLKPGQKGSLVPPDKVKHMPVGLQRVMQLKETTNNASRLLNALINHNSSFTNSIQHMANSLNSTFTTVREAVPYELNSLHSQDRLHNIENVSSVPNAEQHNDVSRSGLFGRVPLPVEPDSRVLQELKSKVKVKLPERNQILNNSNLTQQPGRLLDGKSPIQAELTTQVSVSAATKFVTSATWTERTLDKETYPKISSQGHVEAETNGHTQELTNGHTQELTNGHTQGLSGVGRHPHEGRKQTKLEITESQQTARNQTHHHKHRHGGEQLNQESNTISQHNATQSSSEPHKHHSKHLHNHTHPHSHSHHKHHSDHHPQGHHNAKTPAHLNIPKGSDGASQVQPSQSHPTHSHTDSANPVQMKASIQNITHSNPKLSNSEHATVLDGKSELLNQAHGHTQIHPVSQTESPTIENTEEDPQTKVNQSQHTQKPTPHSKYESIHTTGSSITTNFKPVLDTQFATTPNNQTQGQPDIHPAHEELTTPMQKQQTINSHLGEAFHSLPQLTATTEPGLSYQTQTEQHNQPDWPHQTEQALLTSSQSEQSQHRFANVTKNPPALTVTLPLLVALSPSDPSSERPGNFVKVVDSNTTLTESFIDREQTPDRMETSTHIEVATTKPKYYVTKPEPQAKVTTGLTNQTDEMINSGTRYVTQEKPAIKHKTVSPMQTEPFTQSQPITYSEKGTRTKTESTTEEIDTSDQTLSTTNTRLITEGTDTPNQTPSTKKTGPMTEETDSPNQTPSTKMTGSINEGTDNPKMTSSTTETRPITEETDTPNQTPSTTKTGPITEETGTPNQTSSTKNTGPITEGTDNPKRTPSMTKTRPNTGGTDTFDQPPSATLTGTTEETDRPSQTPSTNKTEPITEETATPNQTTTTITTGPMTEETNTPNQTPSTTKTEPITEETATPNQTTTTITTGLKIEETATPNQTTTTITTGRMAEETDTPNQTPSAKTLVSITEETATSNQTPLTTYTGPITEETDTPDQTPSTTKTGPITEETDTPNRTSTAKTGPTTEETDTPYRTSTRKTGPIKEDTDSPDQTSSTTKSRPITEETAAPDQTPSTSKTGPSTTEETGIPDQTPSTSKSHSELPQETETTTGHSTYLTTNTEWVTRHESESDTAAANNSELDTQTSYTIYSKDTIGPTSQRELTPKTPHQPTIDYNHDTTTRQSPWTMADSNKDQATVEYQPTERTLTPKHTSTNGGSRTSWTVGYNNYSELSRIMPAGGGEASHPTSMLPSGRSRDPATTAKIYRSRPPNPTKPVTSPAPGTFTPSEFMSVHPARDRIVIVEEQQPLFKVATINVTHRVEVPGSMACDRPDRCRDLYMEEVTSAYMAAAGFDRVNIVNETLAGGTLEYRVVLGVRVGSPLTSQQELVLTNPTSLFKSLVPSGIHLLSAIHNASLAEGPSDPCADWFSCPRGFHCVPQRKLSALCLSPCHSAFCQNDGICIHRKGQDPVCQCPVGTDFWYMGPTCDYRMTHHRLAAISCAVVFCIIICAAATVFILVRRFQTQILQQKVAQTQSSYRRFSRFDDVPTHFWCPSQTWLTTSASLNSLDNPAFSSSEEVFPLQALGSCVCGCQNGARSNAPTELLEQPTRGPPRLETSCSSVNDLMIDSGKASDVSVCSWPMEPIHWTPFPILHQLSLQSPFHARRPHSYFEGMELVNTERSWTA